MKWIRSYSFQLITALFLTAAFLGLFEKQAFSFVKEVAEKNITFLALIGEIKVLFASIAVERVPFVSGDAQAINDALNKAENYLLATNIISVIQLLSLQLSKSLIIKIAMGVLWLSTFFMRSKSLHKKLLILTLAVSPGLSIYSTAISHLSHEASFDFGSKYLTELKAKVKLLRSEKAALMTKHQATQQKIKSEKKDKLWQTLREDLKYDLEKTRLDIKGEYTEIRLLFHEAAHTLLKKAFIFCSMILFCLLVLPMGYAILIYTLYKSLFQPLDFSAVPALRKTSQSVQKMKKKLFD